MQVPGHLIISITRARASPCNFAREIAACAREKSKALCTVPAVVARRRDKGGIARACDAQTDPGQKSFLVRARAPLSTLDVCV